MLPFLSRVRLPILPLWSLQWTWSTRNWQQTHIDNLRMTDLSVLCWGLPRRRLTDIWRIGLKYTGLLWVHSFTAVFLIFIIANTIGIYLLVQFSTRDTSSRTSRSQDGSRVGLILLRVLFATSLNAHMRFMRMQPWMKGLQRKTLVKMYVPTCTKVLLSVAPLLMLFKISRHPLTFLTPWRYLQDRNVLSYVLSWMRFSAPTPSMSRMFLRGGMKSAQHILASRAWLLTTLPFQVRIFIAVYSVLDSHHCAQQHLLMSSVFSAEGGSYSPMFAINYLLKPHALPSVLENGVSWAWWRTKMCWRWRRWVMKRETRKLNLRTVGTL